MKKHHVMKNQHVMLNLFQHLLITILGVAFFSIVLTSCENFLKGADTKKQLDEAIEIANKSPVTYYVTAEQDSGIVSPTQFRAKKKETFEIMFTPAEGWEFVSWQVLDRTTGEEVTDAIKFEDETALETKGTILNFRENLKIHAKCIKAPLVMDAEPHTKQAVSTGTQIVLFFNTPVAQSIINTLDISFMGSSILEDCFEAPEFNEDNTVLTISPKPEVLKEYITQSLHMQTIDVQVKIGEGYIIKTDKKDFTLLQNEFSKFNVKYNSELKGQAPEKETAYASSRTEIKLDNLNSIKTEDLLSFDSLSELTTGENSNAKILKNRVKNKVYIYGHYADKDSRVRTIILTETRTNDKSGDYVYDDALPEKIYTKHSTGISYYSSLDGYTEFCIDYDLRSDDGAILLNVSVLDACGETDSAQDINLVVFKDTYINIKDVRITNDSDNITSLTVMGIPDTPQRFISGVDDFNISKVVYKDCKVSPVNLTLQCEYKNSSNEIKTQTFSIPSYEASEQYPDWHYYKWTMNLPWLNNQTAPGKSFYLIVKDDIGNITKKEFCFPEKPVVTYKRGNACFINFEPEYKIYAACRATNSENWSDFSMRDNECSLSSIAPPSSSITDYSFVFKYQRDGLFGPLSDEAIGDDINRYLKNVKFKGDAEYSDAVEFPGYIYVTISIEDNSWDQNADDEYDYDQIYFTVSGVSNDEFAPGKVYYNRPETTATFLYPRNESGDGPCIYLYGVKGTLISEKTTKVCDSLPQEYDIIKPHLDIQIVMLGYSYYSAKFTPAKFSEWYNYLGGFKAKDEHSGLDSIEIKPNGSQRSYSFNADEELLTYSDNLFVPIWDLEETVAVPWQVDSYDNGVDYSFDRYVALYTITLRDKAGNSVTKTLQTPTFYKIPKITGHQKSNNTITFTMEDLGCPYFLWHYGFYKLVYDDAEGKYVWRQELFAKTDRDEDENTIGYNKLDLSTTGFTLSQSEVYKVVYQASAGMPWDNNRREDNGYFGFSEPYYFCGTTTCNKDLSYVMSRNSTSVYIRSNAPVYVHTLVTTHSYNECKDWDAQKWEHNRRQIGEYKLTFSDSDTGSQIYRISDDDWATIENGDCYVIIVHFADGSVDMSEVMVK